MAWRLWVSGRWCRAAGSARQDHGLRFIILKASNRAAVQGVKRPINEKIDEEEVEQEIKKGKEEKESKKKEIEKKVNSQVKRNQDCNK